MKIKIMGSMFGTTGYDNHTRQLFNALYKLNSNIKLEVPLPPNWNRFVNDAELNAITKDNKNIDYTISITTPQFWRLSMDNCKKFVGFLVWEGSNIPEYWMDYILDERVNMIFVPSQHTYDAIWNTYWKGGEPDLTNKPDKDFWDKVKIIPHGVDLSLFYPQEQIKDKFTFVCNKGWRGGMEDRGGVGYVLKAFCEEFNKDENVELLLKTNPSYLPPQNIKQEIDKLQLPQNKPSIRFIGDNISLNKMKEIYNQGDVYICAQLADAFNIPGLESMACGLPTIQTNSGGQTDYMTNDNSWFVSVGELIPVTWDIQYEEVHWSIPDIKDLKEKMRYCFENKEEVKKKGEQALKDVQNWTWNNTSKKVIDLLNSTS